MAVKQLINGNPGVGFNSGVIFDRPRIYELLKKAVNCPLVVICAGAGYGKTRAVYSFVNENLCADVTWMQLSELDNNEMRFWENYAGAVSQSFPEAAAQFIQIGFPDTDEAFAKYSAVIRKAVAIPRKQIMVIDDFHLLHNPVILRHFERAVSIFPPNAVLVIITRAIPDFNIIDMMRQDQVFTINEDSLRFTENEIREYFVRLEYPVTKKTVRNIYDDTQGWAFTVNIIGQSLQKNNRYERHAIKNMKENISRHIGTETKQIVSEPLWHFLICISLIDKLPASFIRTLPDSGSLIDEMERSLHAYIRCDRQSDTYLIHHLLLDYLRQHQQILTDTEKREMYRNAAAWCEANNYHMDAITYHGKSNDYNAIARIIASYNIQTPPDMTKLALEIFERVPEERRLEDSLFTAMLMRLKMNIGQFAEASEIARKYADIYEALPESPERDRALVRIYASYSVVRSFMCTYDDKYDFDIYQKKAFVYNRKHPAKNYGKCTSLSINAWASLVGSSRAEAHEEYINAMARTIKYAAFISPGCLAGLDDLARGELHFYREEIDEAERLFKEAVKKARDCKQYTVYNRTLVYLMEIAVFRSDYNAAEQYLKEMESLLSEQDYGFHYTTYDIALGFYCLLLQEPERIPDWLKGDFSDYVHPSYIENYANRVKLHYHFQTGKYGALLAYIEKEEDRQAILFGKIELAIVKAHTLFSLKRNADAFAALTDAYRLAKPSKIILPFLVAAREMQALASAALKDANCQLPQAWLEEILNKSSAYTKLKARMISAYKTANHIPENPLSNRETVFLDYLDTGLTYAEIAAMQKISVGAARTVINNIYDKLYASGLGDALRIAKERGLISS